MARPKTGSAYRKRGRIYVAVMLRPDPSDPERPRRWARPWTGAGTDAAALRAAKGDAATLQRAYDRGELVYHDGELVTPASLAPAPANRTVIEHVDAWMREQSYESKRKDEGRVDGHVRPSPLAAIPLRALRPADALAFIRWLEARPSEAGGTLGASAVHNTYALVQRALDAAVVAEIIATNVLALPKVRELLPAKHDKHPGARATWRYAWGDVARLAGLDRGDDHVPTPEEVWAAVLGFSGARPGEAAALRVGDYDPTTEPLGRLVLARARKSVTRKIGHTKTFATKEVPVLPPLARVLDRWLAVGFRAFTGRDPEAGDLLLPSERGAVRDPSTENVRLQGRAAALGITATRQYGLRHGFLRALRDAGADRTVFRWATHAPPRDVLDGYTHAPPWSVLCREVAKALPADGSATRKATRAEVPHETAANDAPDARAMESRNLPNDADPSLRA